jgi:tripartite ATP-independent transporter DctM subunit
MEGQMIEGGLTFAILLIMIMLSIPIGFSMIATGIFAFLFFADIPLSVVIQSIFYNLKPYAYSAVLYFVFAGTVMARGALAQKLLDIADAFVGFFPGGIAIAAVVGCGLFGTISGSDLATMTAIGGIIVPALIARGWPKPFAAGLLGASALLGMIIPPSIPGLIYGLFVGISVGAIFLAGVLPGTLIISLFSIYLYFKSKRMWPEQKIQKPNIRKMALSLKNGKWALGMPIIIFGGIYGGVFTVTEAAGAAAAYSLFVELVIHRGLKIGDIPTVAVDSALMTAVVLFLLAGASVLGRYLTLEQIPQMFAEHIFEIITSKWTFILVASIFLLILGCLVDIVTAIVIVMPILVPLYQKFGINEYHFAMIFLLNMYIGYLTPPVGINLYAASSLFNVPLMEIGKAYVPFFFLLLVALILVTIFPGLSTWIPSLVYG